MSARLARTHTFEPGPGAGVGASQQRARGHACRYWPRTLGRARLILLGRATRKGFPDRTVCLYVGFPPGGTTDIAARFLATKLSQAWGRPAAVQNRIGASGAFAASMVAHKPPDGYHLLVASQATMILAPAIHANRFPAAFDAVKDFTPIGLIGSCPQVLVANCAQSFKTLAGFRAHAAAHPASLRYGSGGNGTSPHVLAARVARALGLAMAHAPSKGESIALAALLGGETAVMFTNLPVVLPYPRAGRLRALAISSARRSPLLAQTPTLAESGCDIDARTWLGVFAPAGLGARSRCIIDAALTRTLRNRRHHQYFAAQGFTLASCSSETFVDYLTEASAQWRQLIRELNLRPEW